MAKREIAARGPARTTGPFSPAIRANGFIFLSGQIGFDATTGALVEGGFESQLRQTLTNVTALLSEAGSEWEKVVKVSVFLDDMADYPLLNEIYASFVQGVPPTRTTIEIAKLPLGALVEIDLIALE